MPDLSLDAILARQYAGDIKRRWSLLASRTEAREDISRKPKRNWRVHRLGGRRRLRNMWRYADI